MLVIDIILKACAIIFALCLSSTALVVSIVVIKELIEERRK